MDALQLYNEASAQLQEGCSTHHGLTQAGMHMQSLLDDALERVGADATSNALVKAYNAIHLERDGADYAQGLLGCSAEEYETVDTTYLEAAANRMLDSLK